MSLHCQPVPAIPEEPARVAQAAFSKGNLYLRMRDELGSLYCDEDFAVLYQGYFILNSFFNNCSP